MIKKNFKLGSFFYLFLIVGLIEILAHVGLLALFAIFLGIIG